MATTPLLRKIIATTSLSKGETLKRLEIIQFSTKTGSMAMETLKTASLTQETLKTINSRLIIKMVWRWKVPLHLPLQKRNKEWLNQSLIVMRRWTEKA